MTEVWPTLHRNGGAVEVTLEAATPDGPLAERLQSRLQLLARETKDPYTMQLGGFLVASVRNHTFVCSSSQQPLY